MIAMLDGRADKILPAGPPGDLKRYDLDDYTVLVMDSKRRVIDALHSICALRDDFRLRLVMSAFKDGLAANAKGPPVIAPKDCDIEVSRQLERSKTGKLDSARKPTMVAPLPELSGAPPSPGSMVSKNAAAAAMGGTATPKGGPGSGGARKPSVVGNMRASFNASMNKMLTKSMIVEEEDDDDASNYTLTADFQVFFDDMFEAGGAIDGKALDLDAISESPLGTICMDLMMYDSPELFEASFSLLKTMYAQRTTIIHAMKSVQLLYNEQLPLFHSLKHLKSEVGELRNYIESYETWGVQNSFSPIDRPIFEQVTTSLEKLSKFVFAPPNAEILAALELSGRRLSVDQKDEGNMTRGLGGVRGTRRMSSQVAMLKKRAPEAMWQDLLRNLDIDSLLIRAVEIPYDTYIPTGKQLGTPEGDDMQATYDVLLEVVRAAWFCAKSFVLSHPSNQEIFFKHMDFMVAEMKASPGLPIADMLTEVFRDNSEMIEQADEALFREFTSMLNHSAYDISYLNFFEVRAVMRVRTHRVLPAAMWHRRMFPLLLIIMNH